MKRTRLFVYILLSQVLAAVAVAQPQPVNLQIPNITQETPVWCWAAVAQQIISATVGPQRTPEQCALVAMAYGAHPASCCNGNPQCMVTGSLPQIQSLIAQFGGRFSTIAPPADPMVLYQTLAGGRAIILHVQTGYDVRTGYPTSHVVVLRGMSFVPGPYEWEAVLHVNDPMGYFTQPVLFSQLRRVWIDAIVVN